jgi:hypothetical protein
MVYVDNALFDHSEFLKVKDKVALESPKRSDAINIRAAIFEYLWEILNKDAENRLDFFALGHNMDRRLIALKLA